MNEITKYQAQLPDTIEDLTQFVLVGKAKLSAYMSRLRTVNKLSVAQSIRDQTLQETQELANALIASEQRIGEILLAIPKQSGGDHGNQHTGGKNLVDQNFGKTKADVTKEMGYTQNDVFNYQQMAKNPEVVQKVIDDALANGTVVSKAMVMKEIKALKDELRREQEKKKEVKTIVPDDYKEAKSKARAYDAETNRLNKKLEDAYKQRNKLEQEIKELQEQTVREQVNNDFIAGAIYFIAQCGSFIRDVGGYVWIADKIADLPEKDRTGYIKATMAVRDWSLALLQTIERSDYGKQEIERISNQGE